MATNYQNQTAPITPIVEKTSDTSPVVWVILALLLVIAGYFAYATYYSPTQKMDMRADPTVASGTATTGATTVTPTPDTATVTTPAPTSETISPATTTTDETTRQ